MAPFQEIARSLRQLYLEDERPWLVGLSSGTDNTLQKHRAKGLPDEPPNFLRVI